jgi:hypothetical protein
VIDSTKPGWNTALATLTATGMLFVLAMTVVISWPALTGPFLFDDFPNLEHLQALGGHLDWKSLANYAAQYKGEPGRPLSMLSFVINDNAWPSNPWGFKYTNLMIHLLVGVLVFGLARSLARSFSDPVRRDLTALLIAAAWLLHPMQLSTSMLVVQRMTQLSALFALAGVWSYVALAYRAVTASVAVFAISALGAGTVLALLCKETGALTPLLAVVVNATLLRQQLLALPRANRRLLFWGSLLPVLCILIAIMLRWDSLTGYGNRDFDMGDRLLTQARVLVNYAYQILVPNLRGGGIYHDDFAISRTLWNPWTTLPAIALILGAAAYASASSRSRPVLAFGVLWFVAGHLLESTVFPLEIYFEHRNYLPMFGPLFCLAHAATSAPRYWRLPATSFAIMWILFAAWLTSVQATIWGDARKLTAVWAVEHPESARAMQQRANYVARHMSSPEAAEILLDAYRRGVRGDDFPLQALSIACARQDTALADRAWPLVKAALENATYDNAVVDVMGRLRSRSQRATCPDILDEGDWLLLSDYLLSNPRYAAGKGGRHLHVQRSYVYRNRRDLDGTMRELEAAWAARPTADLAQLIAATLASAGLYDEATLWADRALEHKVGGVRGWLSMDDEKSKKLKHALESAATKNHAQEEPAAGQPNGVEPH